ncbi:MAG: Flp family type IVb pilin [Pirellulaceae bacterium]|nr:hypothetical protein [Planctomycetales bacterium]MCA9165833.1 hypothetical protein [Planctomycetales bacterium]MCA9202818.1 hypothetical protein [Planctomycetales bacterium]MCA9224519.1 hypothetical protein [Planctomycetales bacterium]
MASILKFLREDEAATAVEYAVMLALLIGMCLTAIGLLGLETKDLWADNQTGLQKAFTSSGS